jgi:hypothetical protein
VTPPGRSAIKPGPVRRKRSASKQAFACAILGAMGLAVRQTTDVPDRLTQFRDLRARLNPTGDPSLALSQGLYVPSKHSVSQRLSAELELAPSSTHLLIGGVGSGKTTELLSTGQRLNKLPDTHALYLDVSKLHDISKMPPGTLLVHTSHALAEDFIAHTSQPTEHFVADQVSRGLRYAFESFWQETELRNDGAVTPPRNDDLLPPEHTLESATSRAIQLLALLIKDSRHHWRHSVILFDGLDRMTDMSSFEQLVHCDIRALSSLGVGVALVGPIRAQYGVDRTIADHFDYFHYQPWIYPKVDQELDAFLANVLRQRVPEGMFERQALEELVYFSGGVCATCSYSRNQHVSNLT